MPEPNLETPPSSLSFLDRLKQLSPNPKVIWGSLESVADKVQYLTKPVNKKLYSGSVGFALVPEAILATWEEWGGKWLQLFYHHNYEALTPSPETVAVVQQGVQQIQSECTEYLVKASNAPVSIPFGLDAAIKIGESVASLGDIRSTFETTLGAVKNLSPDQVAAICKDVSQAAELDLTGQYIIPDLQRQVLENLNRGFEDVRFIGIFMTAYSIFADKIASALTPPEAGRLERGLIYALTNFSLAYFAEYANAMLTYIHTGGFIHESMIDNMDLAFLAATAMTLARFASEEVFHKRKTRLFAEFATGAAIIVTVAGPSTLATLKFLLGLSG